jgi:site-specific DNA-methyltransferase (adenine-specific)
VAATRFRPEQSTATVVHGEALDVLRSLPDGCAGLVYVDPPFNTGEFRTGLRTTVTEDASASRLGFAGRHYRVEQQSGASYADSFDDYIGWLRPRIEETRRILAQHGTLYFHIDPRESHYCKVLLDEIFGRVSFLNEVVWAYDYGARTKRRWPAKHDVILVYVKDPREYHFDASEVAREPYMAPKLQTPERAARGPPMSGGTRSSRRRLGNAPGIRHRNHSASCAAWWGRRRVREISSSTGAREVAPPVQPLRSSVAASCSSTTRLQRSM